MSGASIICCRICGQCLTRWHDSDDGRVCESEDKCDGCRLYWHQFAYGATEERIGYVISAWSHTEDPPKNWRDMEAEAKRILASPVGHALCLAALGDEVAVGVFADWCHENGLPLNEAVARADGEPGSTP